jgi:hypothetical protein
MQLELVPTGTESTPMDACAFARLITKNART